MTVTTLRGCFVTGTDTDVGKTVVSAALLRWFAQQGLRSAGFKPVAAGTSARDGLVINDDVRALRRASSVVLRYAEVGPCQLTDACAPHLAAAHEGRHIDRHALLRAAQALAGRADMLVVEGAGGFCVPLGPDWDSADLAWDFGLPVVLVVGLRLGCLNHALLSAQAIVARGLRLAGWVGSSVDADMRWRDENVATLQHELARRHALPCLGVLPPLKNTDAAAAATHLDGPALRRAFDLR